jgi:hypothetical protein
MFHVILQLLLTLRLIHFYLFIYLLKNIFHDNKKMIKNIMKIIIVIQKLLEKKIFILNILMFYSRILNIYL